MRLNPLSVLLWGGLALGSMTGCQKPEAKLQVPARIVDLGVSAPAGSTPIQGLYFGELELVAYNYRPGAATQTGQSFGFNGTHDWSYWVVLQSGHDTSRDNVLMPHQEIDVATLDDGFGDPPEKDFIDKVSVFDIDLFEVYLYRTGVIYNNVYYGMNADFNGLQVHPLHKYPALSSLEDHYCTPEFPGQPTSIQDEGVFFARPDWFPQPVIVNMKQDGNTPPALVIDHSSIPLTTDQENIILSLVNNGTQRRYYDNLVFIPFSTPVSVDLNGSGTPSSVPGAHQYVVGKFRISVNFDLTNIINPDTDWSVPRVVYNGDARNVPFGLSVSFDPI